MIVLLITLIFPMFSVQAKGVAVSTSKTVEKIKLSHILNIDVPKNEKVVDGSIETISGWAINETGIKVVQIYLNNKFIGNANYGISRPDVANVYKSYSIGKNVGFIFQLDTSIIKTATALITIKSLGNDGDVKQTNITIKKPPISCVDNPSYDRYINGKDIKVSGWAINPSGVNVAKIYINGSYCGNAIYGIDRPDLKKAFPYYINSNKSGYEYNIPANKLKLGRNIITVQVTGKDGSVLKTDKNLDIYDGINAVTIDYPNGKTSNKQIGISGWSINKSGVKNVQVYVDNKFVSNANIGVYRPDVSLAFPGYPFADKSGFSSSIDADNYLPGNHELEIKSIGSNGKETVQTKKFSIDKLPLYSCIDTPSNNEKLEKELTVSGWALNPSRVKQVKIYLNNAFIGNATYGINRPDVNKVIPGYPSVNLCGFYYKLLLDKTPPNSYSLKAEIIGNDGTTQSVIKDIVVLKKTPLCTIDSPTYRNIINSNNISINGWALNAVGVKTVNVYLDDKLMGKAQYGIPRADVNKVYPGYPGGNLSGFNYLLNINKVSVGQHVIKIETIGNDASSQIVTKSLYVWSSEPRVFFEKVGDITKGQELNISGWALNKAGINNVKVYIDGVYRGTANYGLSRPDVNATYFGYPQGDKSGYRFTTSVQDLAVGKHLIKVTETGKDSTTASYQDTFNITKLNSIISLDSDFKDYEAVSGRDQLNFSGWALSDSKVKQVNFYLDGVYVQTTAVGISRPDVAIIHPDYPNALTSGYSSSLSIADVKVGVHTVEARVIGVDNSIASAYIHFKNVKIVVIDPGHNFGGDDGAYSFISGITYSERDLNMQLASKLKNKLLEYGYTVIMTRNADERPIDGLEVSLKNRIEIANNANADFFISIHHDASYSPLANGISTHYSTYRPSLDTSGIIVTDGIYHDTTPTVAAFKSADMAQQLADSLGSLGYQNRGKSDHNLFVTQNTKMPSVLVECGFITNPQEAARIANNAHQDAAANKLAGVIYNNIY